MSDLGAGVHEHDDEHFAGTAAPPLGNGPTCPFCGRHDRTSLVNHPCGKWYCTCGHLFTGSDTEWRRLAEHRKKALERRMQNTNEEESG